MEKREIISKKLKNLYFESMAYSNIYTKDEAIELFTDTDFSDDDFLFIQKSEEKAKAKTDVSFDFCNQENIIEYSEDTLEEILLCDEDDYFFINASYKQTCRNTSKLLYKEIKNNFSVEEINIIVEILKNDCINFNKKYKHKIEDEFYYTEEILNSNQLYKQFIEDYEFGEELLLMYVYNYEEKEKEKNLILANEIMEKPDILTINDLLRKNFLVMFNRAIQAGVMPNDVILVIREYLNGKLSIADLKKLYKSLELHNINYDLLINKDYIKRIMICDYCRLKEMQIDCNEISYNDMEQWMFIQEHDFKTIISNFNNNNSNFATNVITDFLYFNNDYELPIKQSFNHNKKLLKKINPCYQLDFIDFSIKKPKN